MNDLFESLVGNPEEAKVLIEEMVGKYKPLLYSVCNELFGIYKNFSNNLEYPATIAKVRKNQFNAYIEVGFTEEQAMVLMINDIKMVVDQFKNSANSVNKNKK